MIQGLGPVMSNLHNSGSNLTRHSSNHINLSLFLAVNENEIKKKEELKKKYASLKITKNRNRYGTIRRIQARTCSNSSTIQSRYGVLWLLI